MKEKIEMFISICVALGLAIAGVTYFATANDLELVDMRLEQKIVNDAVYDITRQIGQLEDKYGTDTCSTWQGPSADRDRNTYRRLKEQLEMMKVRRNALIQQQGKM